MSLIELADHTRTDKNTTHSYLELYQGLLSHKKDTAKNILEIGISAGGSIKLWSDFFKNAVVHGVDILPSESIWDVIKYKDNIVVHASTDAYNEAFFTEHFLHHIQFDMILDDGPHTLESMLQFIKLYSQVMTDDGILIIEDVQAFEWIEHLQHAVPDHLKSFIKVYDLRPIKGRYDDIVFTIDKSQNKHV
jgi:23S rRNA U2552 (ribose-2'-O)-methylase RlmE/FtsJ